MFKGRFTRIKELSDRRRLPRLGKIRLGVKLVSPQTQREYPKETNYFVIPPEVAKVYGENPTSLDVMFPINDPEVVFPQAYKRYGQSRGLVCVGNGEVALFVPEGSGNMEEVSCPCGYLETGDCSRVGHLMCILPRVNMGGVYQIDVRSYHSIVDINSGLDYVQALVGRFAMVPLRLSRVPKETHFGGAKQIHYTLQLFLDGDVETINTLREDTSRVLLSTRNLALPPPEDDERVITEEEKNEDIVEPVSLSEDRRIEAAPVSKEVNPPDNPEVKSRINGNGGPITPQQIEALMKLGAQKGVRFNREILRGLSFEAASNILKEMQAKNFNPEEFKARFISGEYPY